MNQYANDFTTTVKIYYDELKKYKPLTKAKERKLLRLCKKGNLKAKNEILESNLRFVFEVAKHYTGRGVPISDLISEGNLGLIRAIDKFDESKDVKFISYAVWWIRQAMLESIKNRNVLNSIEIEPNESNNVVIETKIMDEEDDDYKDTSPSTELDEQNKELIASQKNVISKLLNVLNEREKYVVENFYGLNDKKEMTLTDIGKTFGISSERTRQIKLNAIRKLRSKAMLIDNSEEFLF